jgi:hypothetical protein
MFIKQQLRSLKNNLHKLHAMQDVYSACFESFWSNAVLRKVPVSGIK